MGRSQQILIAWIAITVMSLNPLTGVLAIDAEPAVTMADCQIVLPANDVDGIDDDHMTNCAQNHACTSYCQFAPLQPSSLSNTQISRRPWLALSGESENLVTRFLEGIERPPRA